MRVKPSAHLRVNVAAQLQDGPGPVEIALDHGHVQWRLPFLVQQVDVSVRGALQQQPHAVVATFGRALAVNGSVESSRDSGRPDTGRGIV